MFAQRIKIARGTIARTMPFFQSTTIPMHLRLLVIQMVIYTSLLYGTEITGGNELRMAPAQTLVNRLLRMVLSVSMGSQGTYSAGIPSHAMWRELGCPPVHAMATARRARMYVKGLRGGLQTHLPTLLANTAGIGSAGSKWSTVSKGILSRLKVPPNALGDSRETYEFVKDKTWEKSSLTALRTKAGRLKFNLGSRFFLCPIVRRETEVFGFGSPTRQLVRMRMDAWWGCSMLARVRLIDEGYSDSCPFCTDLDLEEGGSPESALHAVLQCPAWETQRAQFLGAAIADLRTRLGNLQQRAMQDGRVEFQNLAEDDMILRGLLGGRPFGDMLVNPFLFREEDDLWVCPELDREVHVQAMLGFLHSLSALRGPVIRTLISTQSQSRTGLARRRVHPRALDVT
jgi:hypothetical protein